ncbi:hypothetical protein FRB93_013514 [Tulasnella sp. JGI-2019a]|nr:hypothetical protein FRB93_013514 [Tulasnella sp. JGI-2019a]
MTFVETDRNTRGLANVTISIKPRSSTMESALAVPEILDEILQLATPSTQAAAAQTCQYWSDCSLRWLWRRMQSFYPLLELLSPLICTDNTWSFTSDLLASDWHRFSQYAARIHSMKFSPSRSYRNQDDSVPSPQILDEFNRHCPTPDSMFPKLTELIWRTDTTLQLLPILMFLVPTIKSLVLTCGKAIDKECLGVLGVLGPRKIHLTDLQLTMRAHDQAFLDRLPAILADQTTLSFVALPPCSATRAIVTVLGQLPYLRAYILSVYPEYQTPRELGMEFDWHDEIFPSLDRLTLHTSLASAPDLVAKSHRSRLRRLTLVNQKSFRHAELQSFCSSLSISQPSLTVINLALYSDAITTVSAQSLPFDLFRSLLQCPALVELLVESPSTISYGDEDIATMASSWPDLEILSLCSSPAIGVGLDFGQPLRSVGTFAQSFSRLAQLSIYVNSLDTGEMPDIQSDIHRHRLAVINFGTSPGPEGSVQVASLYLAGITAIGGKIKGRRTPNHVRFLDSSWEDIEERRRRATFWSVISENVKMMHASADRLKENIVNRSILTSM